MIAHQRKIRDSHQDGHAVPTDMSTATVRDITYEEAKAVILKYEWLGNMGTTVRAFGLFFGDEIAGVVCFGHPGSTAITNICGEQNAGMVYWLARGACVHWAHPHSGSHLVNEACKMMGAPWKTNDGKDMPAKFVFIATADSDAGEVGTIYQACNWNYVGKTTSDRMFLMPGQPPERAKSYRVLVKGVIRNRTGRIEKPDADGRRHYEFKGDPKWYYHGDTLPNGEFLAGSDKYPFRLKPQYGKTMKEAEAARLAEVLAEGWQEVKGNPKHMYVGIYGDKRIRRMLRKALTRKPLVDKDGKPLYPKRGSVEVNSGGTPTDSLVRSQDPAPDS